MSKDLDAYTMGQLASGEGPHEIAENTAPDILLAGSVRISRDKADLPKAEGLLAMAQRAVDTLKGLAVLALAVLIGSLALAHNVHADGKWPVWTPRVAAERSYGGLDKAGLQAVHDAALKVKATSIEIVCGGNWCRDIAEDLDEALESAGQDSNLGYPMFDMGKGAGISPVSDDTKALAAAIAKASHGRLVLQVLDPKDAQGHVMDLKGKIVIGLGRRKR